MDLWVKGEVMIFSFLWCRMLSASDTVWSFASIDWCTSNFANSDRLPIIMILAFHTTTMWCSARHVSLCPYVVDLQGFWFTALLSCNILSALRYLVKILRFSSSTGHWIFQNFNILNLTLISLRSLHDGTTWAIFGAFSALYRLGSLDESLRTWCLVYLRLDHMGSWACIMHSWSSSLWTFFAYGWYTDASNFWCWSEYTTCKFFWICPCNIHLLFVLSRDVSNTRSLFHYSLIASHIHVEMLDLSDTSSTPMCSLIFILVLEDNACYFINCFVTLLSYVLNSLINGILGCKETSSSNLLLKWVQKSSLTTVCCVSALSSWPLSTTCLTSEWFVDHLIFICRYSFLS